MKKSEYRKYCSVAIVITAVTIIMLATGNGMLNYSFNFGYLRGLAGFFTGVLCMHTYTSYKDRISNLPAKFFHIAETTLLVSIAICVYEGEVLKQLGCVYLVLFFSSVLIFSLEKGVISQLLKRSGMLKRMGTYSYSIYMTHALLLSLFNIVFVRLLHLPPSAYAWLFALNYLIIYKVSEWTYKHIEMRFAARPKTEKQVQTTVPREVIYAKDALTAM